MEKLSLTKIRYSDLNNRQKENYNYQKVSGILADYGYQTIRLSDDWNGADFLAQHVTDTRVLRVQLKSRCTFVKRYTGGDLWICYQDEHTDAWYLYPHDYMLECFFLLKETKSWKLTGSYSFPKLSRMQQGVMDKFRLDP